MNLGSKLTMGLAELSQDDIPNFIGYYIAFSFCLLQRCVSSYESAIPVRHQSTRKDTMKSPPSYENSILRP